MTPEEAAEELFPYPLDEHDYGHYTWEIQDLRRRAFITGVKWDRENNPLPICTDEEIEEQAAISARKLMKENDFDAYFSYQAGWAACWRYIKSKMREKEDK